MLSGVEVTECFGNVVINSGLSFAGDVDAVVIVYDLTSFASFHSATRWLHDLYQIKKFPVLLFGNKLDLCYNNKGREVNGQESELLKKMEGISKVGSGLVDRVFEGGLIELVQKYLVTDIIFQSEENVSSCCCR